MQEYEQLGQMERVDIDAVLDLKYFISHHCIFEPDSTTTKLKVVFDASAKTSSGHSLNNLMYTGPTVQSELFYIFCCVFDYQNMSLSQKCAGKL